MSKRLKIKKRRRKNIKKYQNQNNKRKQRTTTTKNKYYCQAGIQTTIACVESEDHSHWSIVSYGYEVFKRISVHRIGDQQLQHITISSQLKLLNQQKGRGSLSVRKMNLRSHETSVSIVTEAICTGFFNKFLKPFSAKHFKRSILSHIPECKIFNRKKVALIITLTLKKLYQ